MKGIYKKNKGQGDKVKGGRTKQTERKKEEKR